MSAATRLLIVIVNEADRYREQPLFEALVQRLQREGVAGVTVHAGVMGFGRHHRVHQRGLFGIADDRPMTLLAVDEETRLRSVVPDIRAMVQDGLVVLVDAELVPAQT